MNCKYHKDKAAKNICEKCSSAICEDCTVELGGKKVCDACANRALFGEVRVPDKRGFIKEFIFFCLACFPGAAHLLMGLFSRGMQLLITFIGAFVFFSYLNTESFIPLVVIPLWFFSFFDSYHLRKRIDKGEEVVDATAYDYGFIMKNKNYLGIGMIALGFVGFLNSINSFGDFQIIGVHVRTIIWAIRRGVFPLALVVAGFYLISKNKKLDIGTVEDAEDIISSEQQI